MTEIAGLPFWQLTFDAQGHTDAAASNTVAAEIKQQAVTDLIVFSHGWNNSQATARKLYTAFFTTLAGQLDQARTDRPVKVGLVGVFWPSQRWSDEPIPDFEADSKAGAKPAAGGAAAAEPVRATVAAGAPTLDAETEKGLKALFPAGADNLNRMAELLAGKATTATIAEFKAPSWTPSPRPPRWTTTTARVRPSAGTPRMLEDDPADLFGRYANQLRESGVTFDDGGGGEAGIADKAKDAWHGAKEALRQLTYFQMKNRAGVVGRNGLGPFLGKIAAANTGIRINLVGHSFGARLVSFTLAGLPRRVVAGESLTLLEGAFSHFAFASPPAVRRQPQGRPGGDDGRHRRAPDGVLLLPRRRRRHVLSTGLLAAQDDSAAALTPGSPLGRDGPRRRPGASARSTTPCGAGRAGHRLPVPATSQALNIDPPTSSATAARPVARTATSSTRS